MASKYQQVIKALYQEHPEVMAEFKVLHDKYASDQKKWQKEYNDVGLKVVETIRFYEKQLCGKSERSSMGVYSSKLAEKFWMEIKKTLPMIDFVGVKIS